MLGYLFFGFAVGLRHALEADHVAAVVSLASRGGSVRAQAAQGFLWGLGHALTLLAVAGASLLLGIAIPASWERAFEAVVGVVLVVLGLSVLARLRRRRVHVHGHRHADGTFHVHAHGHADETTPASHAHVHVPLRALGVGLAHGLAGSAALAVLVAASAHSTTVGLLYVALFGVGSLLGMMALAASLSVPMRSSARFHALLGALAGGTSLSLGAVRIWAFAAGAHS